MGLSTESPEPSDANGAAVADRLRDIADLAAAQLHDIGRRAEQSRRRRQVSVRLGVILGAAGLAGSVLVAVQSGTATGLWWLAIPAWAMAATPVVLLLQDGVDRLPALEARAAACVALAQGLGRILEAIPPRSADEVGLTEVLEPLTRSVEQDLRANDAALRPKPTPRSARRHARIVPRRRKVVVTTADGRRLIGNIADVSPSGVAMAEALPRLAVGDGVLIGRTPAVMVRRWDKGIAFRFDAELDPATFDEEVVL